MKILIMGAAGVFGRQVIPQLAPSHELVLADRNEGEVAGLKVRALDVADYDAVLAAMDGVDAVVNLVIASLREFVTDHERFDADIGEEYLRFNEASIEANVRGAYHIYEAARTAGVKRVIYGSSLTVYLGQPRIAFQDDSPYRPVNFYAMTKMWGEQMGELYSRKHGLTVYCLRFGQPYPMPDHPKAHLWKDIPVGKQAAVTFADLASSMESALTFENGPAFGAYTIVSAAKDCLFDTSKALEIGWKSKTFCHDDGSITPVSE